MLLEDITAPYSATESWVYDTLIAPAVDEMREAASRPLIDALPHGGAILEVGCGGGQLAVDTVRERTDLAWTGLDISAEQIARARRRGKNLPALRFVEGSALELPFDDASFDAVLTVASIKHWPDPGRGLAECVRVLRPGGALAVVEADRGCRIDDARRFVAMWRIPALLRPIGLAIFRTVVAGNAFDLDDARALLAPLELEDGEVRRVEGTPGWLMTGRKGA